MDTQKLSWLRRALGGRIARNVYFWALSLYLAFGLNAGNESAYHYGIIYSSWYLPVMLISLLLQCTLVYTNNLWLVPKFLARRKRAIYGCLVLLLATIISVLAVVLFKTAKPYLNVEELQHPGFTTTSISGQWTAVAIASEVQTFFIANLVWLLVFTMGWFMNDYARQQRALRQSEQQRIQAELAFLKNQINPHFLFNTLNNIYGLALSKSDATPEAILKLSSMLRYLLYESDTAVIHFQHERTAIEAYVEIEALRLPDDAYIRLDIHTDRDYSIPALLWLPLLENAFKHGTRLIGIPISVDFSFSVEGSLLKITASNNCMADESPGITEGIGLANLRKRLELLYPGRYTLEMKRSGQSFLASLTVQLK